MFVRLLKKSWLADPLQVQHILEISIAQNCFPLRFQEDECFEDSKALTLESSRLGRNRSASAEKHDSIQPSNIGKLGEDDLHVSTTRTGMFKMERLLMTNCRKGGVCRIWIYF